MHKDGWDRRLLLAEILQGAEVEVVADKCAGVPRHSRLNSSLIDGSRDYPDRRSSLQPIGRGAGDPEPSPLDALIVWRLGVVQIVREPLHGDDSAARSLTGHQKRIRPKGLDRVDELLHRGVVGAGQ